MTGDRDDWEQVDEDLPLHVLRQTFTLIKEMARNQPEFAARLYQMLSKHAGMTPSEYRILLKR